MCDGMSKHDGTRLNRCSKTSYGFGTLCTLQYNSFICYYTVTDDECSIAFQLSTNFLARDLWFHRDDRKAIEGLLSVLKVRHSSLLPAKPRLISAHCSRCVLPQRSSRVLALRCWLMLLCIMMHSTASTPRWSTIRHYRFTFDIRQSVRETC